MIDIMEGTFSIVQNVALGPDELHQIDMKKLLMVLNKCDLRKMATMHHLMWSYNLSLFYSICSHLA